VSVTTPDRGIDYADGGTHDGTVAYPDPVRVRRIHAEWAAVAAVGIAATVMLGGAA
jgi:hypothetical protein